MSQRSLPSPPESQCPRVALRIFCDECGYPRSEAFYSEDENQEGIPHILTPSFGDV